MSEGEPEIEHITLAVNKSMKPVAMSKLAEMASNDIVEIIEPARSDQFNPELVEWRGPVGQEVAIITSDTLKNFTAKTSSRSKAGVEIINKFRLEARTNTDLQRYLYYEPGDRDATGLLATTFDELLDRLGVDVYDLRKATLRVGGLGRQWFRILKRYQSKLHPNQEDKTV
jgi:hypothetical protein